MQVWIGCLNPPGRAEEEEEAAEEEELCACPDWRPPSFDGWVDTSGMLEEFIIPTLRSRADVWEGFLEEAQEAHPGLEEASGGSRRGGDWRWDAQVWDWQRGRRAARLH